MVGLFCLRNAAWELVDKLQEHLREIYKFLGVGLGHELNLMVRFVTLDERAVHRQQTYTRA